MVMYDADIHEVQPVTALPGEGVSTIPGLDGRRVRRRKG
jgi:hypothetical protein